MLVLRMYGQGELASAASSRVAAIILVTFFLLASTNTSLVPISLAPLTAPNLTSVWFLSSRPKHLALHNFAWRPGPSTSLSRGECLVQASWLSIDARTRPLMRTHPVGSPVGGALMGTVERCETDDGPNLRTGQRVYFFGTWSRLQVVTSRALIPIEEREGISALRSLDVFSVTGRSAYFGVMDIGKPKRGEVALVSAAAGGVGSVAVQILKSLGCIVIGIASTDEKLQYVRGLGANAAINCGSSGIRTHASISLQT